MTDEIYKVELILRLKVVTCVYIKTSIVISRVLKTRLKPCIYSKYPDAFSLPYVSKNLNKSI